MPNFNFILYFCATFSLENVFAGCTIGSFYTSNGLSNWYNIYHPPAVLKMKSDTTFQLIIRGNSSCFYRIKGVTITFNGDTIFSQKEEVPSVTVKIAEKAGVYQVSCYHTHQPGNWVTTFTLIPPPLVLEIQSYEMMSDTATNNTTEHLPETILQIFPIPAHKIIQIVNATEEIHQISIMDLQGKLITFLEPNSHHVKLPIDNIPSGLYLLKIATLSNKVTVRRIPVL